jgi:hypothetical protein
MFDLDKSSLEVACPSCEFPNAVTIREIRFCFTVPCRGCKRNIRLMPIDGGMDKAKRAIEDVVSEFPKNITIKI